MGKKIEDRPTLGKKIEDNSTLGKKDLDHKIYEEDKKNHLPWVEKYRPNDLSNVIGQDTNIFMIKKFLINKDLPNLLFYGPPGTGKTSTIVSLAHEIYGKNPKSMVLELNASDKRGIESVRQDILKFVRTGGYQSSFKLVILDETDAMTADAQSVLRRIIEEYSFNARFCLICNNLNKIDPALISRCTKFYFPPLNKDNIEIRMNEIIKIENKKLKKKEKIIITEDGKEALIKRSKGDMRNILNALQAISIIKKTIDSDAVNDYLSYPRQKDVQKIWKWLNQDMKIAHEKISDMQKKKGYSLPDIISALSIFIIQNKTIENPAILIVKLAKLETNMSSNISEKIQLMALTGITKI